MWNCMCQIKHTNNSFDWKIYEQQNSSRNYKREKNPVYIVWLIVNIWVFMFYWSIKMVFSSPKKCRLNKQLSRQMNSSFISTTIFSPSFYIRPSSNYELFALQLFCTDFFPFSSNGKKSAFGVCVDLVLFK